MCGRKSKAKEGGPGLVSEEEIVRLAEAWLRGTGQEEVPEEALAMLIDDLTEARLVCGLYGRVLAGEMSIGGLDRDGKAVFRNDPPSGQKRKPEG